jgi:hypothetical protein
VVTAQDLLDRTLHIDLPTLSSSISELELDQYWQEHHAAVFTGLLDAFVLALAQLPKVDLSDEKLPRMSDFTLLGEAVYQSQGLEPLTFLNEYRERRKEGVNRTLDASPVAMAMIEYLKTNPKGYDGTVKGLLHELSEYREEGEAWVKSAKGLGDAIQRLKPSMRQIGIALHKDVKSSRDGVRCTLKYAERIYPSDNKTPKTSSPSSQRSQQVHSTTPKTDETVKKESDLVVNAKKCELGEHGELHTEFHFQNEYIDPKKASSPDQSKKVSEPQSSQRESGSI